MHLQWVLAGTAVVLVVASMVLVLTADAPDRLPEGSPGRTVQRFVEATLDGDRERAASLLADRRDGEGTCDLVVGGPDAAARVVLVRTERTGDRAEVTVVISQVRGFGLLGPDEIGFEDRFELRRAGGTWMLTWVPWPFATCEDKEAGP